MLLPRAGSRGRKPEATALLKLENQLRRTVAQILGGILIVAGLVFSGRQYQLQEVGQVTDRFLRATNQLGDKDEMVRIGALFALQRLARDSYADSDAIARVIAAFVRKKIADTGAQDPVAVSLIVNVEELKGLREPEPAPSLEIRTALVELGRLLRDRGLKIALVRAPLRAAHLEAAGLSEAQLMGSDLVMAHLEGAILKWAKLNGAHLELAHLEGTKLQGACLADAFLTGAFVNKDTDLSRAILVGAKFDANFLEQLDEEHSKNIIRDWPNPFPDETTVDGKILRDCRAVTHDLIQ